MRVTGALIFALCLVLACSSGHIEEKNNIELKVAPSLEMIIDEYNERMRRLGDHEYDYILCTSAWSNNLMCLTASKPESPPKSFTFFLDYQKNKKIYFVTGLEGLLINKSQIFTIDHREALIYDPPVLCFEKTDNNKFALCEDRQRCWHCTWPPPAGDVPTFNIQSK